jgi:hypothetical protein
MCSVEYHKQQSKTTKTPDRGANKDEKKQIYDLTVELGCLREENNQLKQEKEEQHEDFQ